MLHLIRWSDQEARTDRAATLAWLLRCLIRIVQALADMAHAPLLRAAWRMCREWLCTA